MRVSECFKRFGRILAKASYIPDGPSALPQFTLKNFNTDNRSSNSSYRWVEVKLSSVSMPSFLATSKKSPTVWLTTNFPFVVVRVVA